MRFTCIPGCTACCRQPGLVYLCEEDLDAAAAHLGMSPAEFEARYVVRTAHRMRFRKPKGAQCPFLTDAGCAIHPNKPAQCRTFPLWPEILEDEEELREALAYCPGIGQGPDVPLEEIQGAAREMRASYPWMYPARPG